MIEVTQIAKPKDGPAPRWFHVAVAASMVISAVSALVATLHTGRTMTALVEQNARLVRAGSTPVLEFGHGNMLGDGTRGLDFEFRNVGSGMARVVWFELSVDGKVVPNMNAAISAVAPELKESPGFSSGPVARRVFAPGSEQTFFKWRQPDASVPLQQQAWRALDQARFKRITVQACYCSVFQECWISKFDGELPTPVAQCTVQGRVSLQG